MDSLRENLIFRARLARRYLRRMQARLRYGWNAIDKSPILFANSFPKSGTHLLTQVLGGFTKIGPVVKSGLPAVITFRGDTGHRRKLEEILIDLKRLLPGDIAYGHLHARPEILSQLTQNGYATYFILRDPRDVVVSHVHYVSKMAPNHIHHRYYTEELETFDQRLSTSIRGIPDSSIPFPNVRTRFEPFFGWLENKAVLSLHYEDFIHKRRSTIAKVLDHASERGFPLMVGREAAIDSLIVSIDPARSPTFRSGKTGGWKDHFTAEHKRLFKQIGGDLLIRLGYESNDDW
jgi:hypothetical protein